jgi:hypothetical protein
VLAGRGLSSFSSLSVARGDSPAHDRGAIGWRRHLGYGSQHQPRRGSRSPPIHLVSQLRGPSLPVLVPSTRPGGRHGSTHLGHVIDGPVPPDREEDPRQTPRQRHHGDAPAAPAGNPLRPVAQRRCLRSLALPPNAPRRCPPDTRAPAPATSPRAVHNQQRSSSLLSAPAARPQRPWRPLGPSGRQPSLGQPSE